MRAGPAPCTSAPCHPPHPQLSLQQELPVFTGCRKTKQVDKMQMGLGAGKTGPSGVSKEVVTWPTDGQELGAALSSHCRC